jgi:hypothetical protein
MNMTLQAKKRAETFCFDYQVIPANQGQPVRKASAVMSALPHFEELDNVVRPVLGGGTLMRVGVLFRGEERNMFVDDLAHTKELPRNEFATELYRGDYLASNPGTDPESLPVICGPAVLFDEQVWF